jgi:hypothetical protein
MNEQEINASRQEFFRLVSRLCNRPAQDPTNLGVDAATIRDEIGDALAKHAANLQHAARIVEALVYQQWRPGPAEIAAAAEETILDSERPPEKRPDPDCRLCSGSGFQIIERSGQSGARKCSCWAHRPAPAFVSAYSGSGGEAVRVAPDKMQPASELCEELGKALS